MKNSRRLFFVTLLASCAAATPLMADSPAKPAPAPATLTDGAYELTGFFGVGDWQEVSLKKAGEAEAKWVRVGQKIGKLRVESADAAKGFAVVNIAGARYRLNLRGERQALPASVESEVVVVPGSELSPEANRRIERFQSLLRGLTSEQRQNVMTSKEKKLDAFMRKNSTKDHPGVDIVSLMKASRSAFIESLREELQAPGADGKSGVVPPDLEKIVDESSGGTPVGDTGLIGVELPADPANPNGPRAMTIGFGMGGLTTKLKPTPAPAPASETK
jgi:hypothetical protein